MNKVYSRIIWKNYPNTSTAINETNLNRMDKAIDDLDNRVIEQDSTKANQTTVNNMVKNWTMDETTGVITVEKQDGSKIMFDLNIEKIPVDFEMSPSGILTMTTSDGTQFTANIGSMIPVLTFNESDQIAVSVSGSGVNKTYSFSIKDNSITENKLQPNFLADIKVQSANASLSANNAETSATQAQSYAIGGTGTRENEDTDNAMYYYEQTKQTDIGQISSKVDEINSKLSEQLGSHTVKSDVPENAVFTDTVYDDTEVQKRLSDNGYGEVAGGKNLCPQINLHTTYNGVTLNTNKDGSLSLSGTVTKQWTKIGLLDTTLDAGTYTFGLTVHKANTYLELYFDADSSPTGISSTESISFTLDKSTRVRILYSWNIVTFNDVIYPQLEEGSVATEYEPYFPSNKMLAEETRNNSEDVDTLKKETTVNLLNPTLQTTTFNGVTCTNNGDGTYTLNGTATANFSEYITTLFGLSQNESYKLLGTPVGGSAQTYSITLLSEDFSDYVDDIGEGVIITPKKSSYLARLNIFKGTTVNNLVFKPILTTNLNATIDDFVGYTGSTGSLNGDVADIRKDIKTLENYKTTETVIGKWDDYTLCRKVISGNHAITAGNEFSFLVDTITSDEGVVMEIKNIRGRARGSILSVGNKDVDGVMAVGSYCNANYYCGCFMPGSSPESISLLGKFGNSVNYVEVELCVEYTVERI